MTNDIDPTPANHGLNDDLPYFAFHARLVRGIGEQRERFASIGHQYISECAADKFVRISKRYGMESHNLRVFLATDTPAFRVAFKMVMLRKAPHSRVVYMKNGVTHFLNMHDHKAHLQMHLENMILGDAREIVSFWSGFSLVARW